LASSNKTQNLGLNFWAATDPVLRDDFNADNQRLDTALGTVMALPGLYYATGSWVGDGKTVGPGMEKAELSLTFDFEPLVIFIDLLDSPQSKYRTILFRPCTKAQCTPSSSADTAYINLTWTPTGVSWYGNMSQSLYNYNANSTTYVYGAIGRKSL